MLFFKARTKRYHGLLIPNFFRHIIVGDLRNIVDVVNFIANKNKHG
jgi:hypothetical protein